MLYPITSIRPTSANENQMILAYHPRNGKDVPESERKTSSFVVLPVPVLSPAVTPESVEYRFILQAVQTQASELLAEAVKAGITELPAFTLADLLESAKESADGVGRLSQEKISAWLKANNAFSRAAATMAAKNNLPADNPAIAQKLNSLEKMILSLTSKGQVVEEWLATASAFLEKYLPPAASDPMTAKLMVVIAAKREINKRALEAVKADNIEW